jgi:signal transduction histidine kinase
MYTPQQNVLFVIIGSILFMGGIVLYFIYSRIRLQRDYLKIQQQSERDRIELMDEQAVRIASDFHDEIGPILSGTMYKIGLIDTYSPQDERYQKESIEHIRLVVTKMRNLSYMTLPDSVITKGPLYALEEFYDMFAKDYPIKLVIKIFDCTGLSPECSVHLYRMLQEIIHNTMKHAGDCRLVISGEIVENNLVINTKDNGQGFDKKTLRGKRGMGLQTIATRAHMIGATLSFESTYRGTSYKIELPLNPQ